MGGKAKENRYMYLSLGVLLTIIGIYCSYGDLARGEFVDSVMILALGVSQLFFAYLSPHIFPRDERAKAIIGKAMTANYFILFVALLILFILTGQGSLGIWQLSASQVLIVLFSIMVIAIPATMVVYSRMI
ncbi:MULTISPECIES: hypothetical protein [Cytobacillus]|uniref:Permease n=1 Tax=Cytobacillus stercorigallinarum TaxID=2762240 RepID=A0ABR8QT25_9BACI|nr:hypothetical protein [Cytobacillus stercorigallinarum]MBD7938679.1 hypothetical protein [Cytobacillus stercorigallinarum]